LNSTHPKKPWLAEFILLSALWGASFLFMQLGAAEFGALPVFLLPLLLMRGLWAALVRHRGKLFFLGMLNSGLPFASISFLISNELQPTHQGGQSGRNSDPFRSFFRRWFGCYWQFWGDFPPWMLHG